MNLAKFLKEVNEIRPIAKERNAVIIQVFSPGSYGHITVWFANPNRRVDTLTLQAERLTDGRVRISPRVVDQVLPGSTRPDVLAQLFTLLAGIPSVYLKKENPAGQGGIFPVDFRDG